MCNSLISKYEAAMPQFDISSFIVQLIWLFCAVIGFYLALSLFFLPITCQYIKARTSTSYSLKNCGYPLVNQAKSSYSIVVKKKQILF